MGKPRQKDRTKDPIKPPSDPELATIRATQILPIIAGLTSPEPKKRSSAAVTISNIIGDTKYRKLLLREKIVRILLEQTIADSALESKSAGWGILKNLALEEEADFCIHLYRQDILTAVQVIAQNIIDTIQSKEATIISLPKAQQNTVWTLATSVIGLISCLAEAQDKILEALSQRPIIINLIFALLGFGPVPEGLLLDVMHCLATLTEDNELLTKQIVGHDSWLRGLMELRESGGSKAVAACGVLHNIFSVMQWFDHNTPMEGASDALLVPRLIQCIDEAQAEQGGLTSTSSLHSTETMLQQALEIIASIATSLQEALEHANQNEKEFEGFSDSYEVSGEAMMEDGRSDVDDSGEEMNKEEMDADMELIAGPDAAEDDGSMVGQPTLDALIRIATPIILLVAQNSGTRDNVRASALSALNNISWTVSSIESIDNHSGLSKLWERLAQRIWSEIVSPVLTSNTADIGLASLITSVAWALARSVQGQLKLEGDEHRKFIALYQASTSLPTAAGSRQNGDPWNVEADNGDAFQGLGVKCIGVLGRLALHPAPIPLNREVGIFLLTVLSALPNTPAADAVEAQNQLFDIYADKAYAYDEAVFWGDGFYQHLEAIVPKARNSAKSIDKRKFTELRLRADEAVLNLRRFLTYKQKEKITS